MTKEIRPFIIDTLTSAADSGAIIIYDPNFREPHVNDLPELKPMILENLRFPDIIRGSDNDFYLIFNCNNVDEAFHVISGESNANLIYTQNRNGVDLITLGTTMHIPAQDIIPVSTIGAGDNFNAGIIWTLIRHEITKKDIEHLPYKQWEKIINNGIRFASNVCMSYNNYISIEFAVEMLRE